MLAQTTNSTTAAWFTLAGALGGVALTSAVALTTAVLNHRWQKSSSNEQLLREKANQLRQERRDAYSNYWLAAQRYVENRRQFARFREREANNGLDEDEKASLDRLREEALDLELAWRESFTVMFLIATEGTLTACAAHRQSIETIAKSANRGQ